MSSMFIKVTNNGVTKDGHANMSFELHNARPISRLNEIYFLTLLDGLHDADKEAFLNALEAFFKNKMEQDDDEE